MTRINLGKNWNSSPINHSKQGNVNHATACPYSKVGNDGGSPDWLMPSGLGSDVGLVLAKEEFGNNFKGHWNYLSRPACQFTMSPFIPPEKELSFSDGLKVGR